MIQEQSIELKTSLEVARMRRPGRVVAQILKSLRHVVRPGVTTNQLSREAERLLDACDSRTALKGYRGFPGAICASVNSVAVHGIPDDTPLVAGDIVSIDLTVEKGGWHGDSAWTYLVGPGTPDTRRLLRAAWGATLAGVRSVSAGGRFGDIGSAVELAASRFGCSVLDRFVGHGIGKRIHEDPMVLHTGESGTGAPIVPGMVFTVEPILSLGESDVFSLDDGWSMVTKDRSLCAQFEQTVAVFSNRIEILTFDGDFVSLDSTFPPY